MTNYYAVRNGRKTGIFTSWDDCSKSVTGYGNADFKKFYSKEDAKAFLQEKPLTRPDKPAPIVANTLGQPYAFVDGSFNPVTHTYGFGAILVANNQEYVLQGASQNKNASKLRNVAGELDGAMAAINKALELQLTHLTIYYDYLGIEHWATKEWRANKEITQNYANFIDTIKWTTPLQLTFVKVKAHTGVELNERVDQLAKDAVGV